MKISIITPSYNQKDFIEETIKSVLSQNGEFALEYIVIDGGSTDGTKRILKKYKNKIKYFSGKDKGQSDAINKGLRMATGDVLAYLNSDDLYEPHALQKVAEFFKKNPNTMWCYGKCKIINKNGQEIKRWITAYKNFLLRKYSYNKLLAENFISQPAVFFRKQMLQDIGYFDETHHFVMDYEYWLRLGKKYDAGIIKSYLSSFRWHAYSKGGAEFRKQFKDDLEVAKKYAEKKKWPVFLHYLNYFKTVFIYSLIKK